MAYVPTELISGLIYSSTVVSGASRWLRLLRKGAVFRNVM